ncbi:MAG: hypothetical protein Q2484_15595 [Candidatus Sedimenticola sp. (ex Thyasira tokunagai)]
MNNWFETTQINPAGLDHAAEPNQHARVDILADGADIFSTTTGVLDNYYLGADVNKASNPYTAYEFDITSVVALGGDFTLRFAEVDNQFYLNQGIDNVSIKVSSVPIPGAVWLFGTGLVGLIGLSRKKRAA